MDTSTAAVRTYFGKLGLDTAVADIYLSLYSSGPQYISQLARTSKVERTRIYRLIDQLMESNLIELEAGQGARGVIKAAPITNLRILIDQRHEALKNLQDELDLIEQTLARNTLSNPAIRVQTHVGHQGLQNLLWSVLSTAQTNKSPLVVHSNFPPFQQLESALGQGVAVQWRQEFKELVETELVQHTPIRTEADLPAWFMLYNAVTVFFEWRAGTFFGTEIHNKSIADTYRQLVQQYTT